VTEAMAIQMSKRVTTSHHMYKEALDQTPPKTLTIHNMFSFQMWRILVKIQRIKN